MYLISDQNGVIGLCDKPNYVKDKNGILVECEENEADGIAFRGTFYNITDVTAKHIDGGMIAFGNSKDIESNSNGLFDIAELKDENSSGIFELAEYIAELEAQIEALKGGD